jgi:hypothetical protein
MHEKGQKSIKMSRDRKRSHGKRRSGEVDNDQVAREDLDWIGLVRNKVYWSWNQV